MEGEVDCLLCGASLAFVGGLCVVTEGWTCGGQAPPNSNAVVGGGQAAAYAFKAWLNLEVWRSARVAGCAGKGVCW